MHDFEDTDDVVEWLKPMDYEEFWKAVEPFYLDLDPKHFCDEEIARGVDEALVLRCLKNLARLQIAEMLGLKWRTYLPIEAETMFTTH
ncbi:MAG: hypothetical protein AAF360_01565 [Pseudomonadota bacterium]